jgi:tetratricopeptide (TPR) repeat protein
MVREVLAIRQKLLAAGGTERLFVHYVARAHANLARVLTAVGREAEARQEYQEALKLLEQAAKEYPDTPHYRAGLAKALLALADLLKDPGSQGEVANIRRRVIGLYEELTADFPEDMNSRHILGILLQESGRYAEAADQYRQALERDPEYHPVNNHLAWLLATSPEPRLRNAAEAVRLAEKAVAARPKAGNYWNTLGVAHYRNGDDEAAVATLEKAMPLRGGGDGFDWFFLAMAHWRLGDRDKARAWFDRAVQWMDKRKPKDEELRRLRAEAEGVLAEAGKS